jgi:uncharacterized protein
MASVSIQRKGLELDAPTLVEGLPGVGLVGKIAVDHLIDECGMVHYANIHCDGLPAVAAYGADDTALRTPVRLYADPDRDLLVLQSDVPVAPGAATTVADCLGGWFTDRDVTPVYLSGLPSEKDEEVPALFGVAAGDGGALLDDVDIGPPPEAGLITGPTGALLEHAVETDTTAVALVVESDPQFPDPEAARVLLKDGIGPLAAVDVPLDDLVEHAEDIREAKERLAERMQDATAESTQAQPLRMYQ